MIVHLATLRPAGNLGDGLDSSYEEGSDVFGLLHVPAAPVGLTPLAVTPDSIAFLRFYARVGWYRAGLGPLDASAWVQWQVGGGAYEDGDQTLPPGGEQPVVVTQIGGLDIAATPAPDLAAWTVAKVNALGVRGVFSVDDAGSGELTFGRDFDFWVEVWGEPAAGAAQGVVRATGTAAVEVGAGEVATVAAANGTAGVEVAGGEVATVATGTGTAGVEIGSGWV